MMHHISDTVDVNPVSPRISSCHYVLYARRVPLPPQVGSVFNATLCTQDDTEIQFQQNKEALERIKAAKQHIYTK